MVKKTKLGPANDLVDDEEMFLAKLIQNAASRGMKSISYMRYAKLNMVIGFKSTYVTCEFEDRDNAVACCAAGAADFEDDTDGERGMYPGMVDGNDMGYWLHWPSNYAGESIGWAFREALRDD